MLNNINSYFLNSYLEDKYKDEQDEIQDRYDRPEHFETNLVYSEYDASFYDIVNIDERLDIFSELPLEIFSEKSNTQVADLMRLFRKKYTHYISTRNDISETIPKLKSYIDDEGALIVQFIPTWSTGNATLYFSFEQEYSDSSFGIIWNDRKEKAFKSRSDNLELSNKDEIIDTILLLISKIY